MDRKAMARRDILKRVERGELSSDEALAMIRQLQAEDAASEMVCFHHEWTLSNPEASAEQEALGNVLIFDQDGRKAEIIRRQLSLQEGVESVIVVTIGDCFRQQGSREYSIHPHQSSDYEQLFQELKRQKMIPRTVIHQWSRQGFPEDRAAMEEQLQDSVYSMTYTYQALMGSGSYEGTILYVYPSSREDVMPQYAGMSGFVKSLNHENPRFAVKTLSMEAESDEEHGKAVCQELLAPCHESDVRYEFGKRLVKRLTELAPAAQLDDASIPLQEQGVYIITGGMGGLGLIFAEYLAQKAKARLVLTGRSPMSAEKAEKLERLRSLGAEAIYVAADMGKREEAARVVEEAKASFHALNGIIHSAGVTRDTLLVKKGRADLDEVLSPKVYGTMWLDELTQLQPLDFFILFSSMAAQFGNAGQADYAYANGYLDAFAERREALKAMMMRSGKTFSIQWPLWKDGGMQVNKPSLVWLKDRMGIVPLTAEQGVQAFERALCGDRKQLLVLSGNREQIQRFVREGDKVPALELGQPPSVLSQMKRQQSSAPDPVAAMHKPSQKRSEELKKQTAAYLRNILSEETKIPVQSIKMHDPLEKYGIDSMMIMSVTRRLEADFGALPKTLFFEYQTLEELAEYFTGQHSALLEEKLGISQAIVERDEAAPVQGRQPEPAAVDQRNAEPVPVSPKLEPPSHSESGASSDIAIIGISGRYPMSDHVEQFWEILKSGKDCISEVPSERWDHSKYFESGRKKKGKTYSKWGGFISDFDKFDPLFFNISPKEAEMIDPQERLFLETVWHTIEDAGYVRSQLQREKVGVFVGVMYGQYQLYGADSAMQRSGFVPASSYASIANRASYYFNFKGPSMALDTMCSSSLTSIHLACGSLQKGESTVAVAGGVNITVHPNKYLMLSEGDFTASDGRCRSFGEGGDGYVPGEGVGAVLLKPLERAIQDGDHIYGVIKGSSLNHGGKTNGYTVPNPNAQGELIAEAIRQAGVSPHEISYIEAHGTGTSLGDPIEIAGLTKAFEAHASDSSVRKSCLIGSVKSNIGHLESAAGIAALTKVLLQMKYKQIVPSIHSERLNPNIDFNRSVFQVASKLGPWDSPIEMVNGEPKRLPRIAGISSFGAGGSNAHLIVQEYDKPAAVPLSDSAQNQPHLILLSAKNKDRLKAYVRRWIAFLSGERETAGYPVDGTEDMHGMRPQSLPRMISEMADVPVENIDPAESVMEYISDPVDLARLTERMKQAFQVQIEASIYTESISIQELEDQLIHRSAANQAPISGLKAGSGHLLNISDIAYTLQVGREAMEERLALVVSSTEELLEKLLRFDREQALLSGVYTGNVKDMFRSTSVFEGETGEWFLKTLTENRELHKLAELWLSDVEIQWGLLHQGGAKRIPLPCYPFAKERYWAPMIGNNEAVEKLHPLIGRNTSSLHEMKFTTVFDQNDPFTTDYEVGQNTILPPFASIEMAMAAGKLANAAKVAALSDIVWGTPLIIDREEVEVQIRLYPDADQAAFEISAGKGKGSAHILSQGRLSYQTASQISSEGIDPDAILLHCTERLYTSEEWQERMSRQQMRCGDSLQALETIALGKSEALSSLRGHLGRPEAGQVWNEYTIPPAMLEGVMQTVSAVHAQRTGSPSVCYAPQAMDELLMIEDLAQARYIYVLGSEDAGSGSGYRYSIRITDEAGNVLCSMKGLSITALLAENGALKSERQSDGLDPAESLSIRDLQRLVGREIQSYAAAILKMRPEQIDFASEFDQFGFDSVGLKEYADRLSVAYGIDVSPTVFFSAPNIQGLSEHLVQSFEKEIRAYYERNKPSSSGAAVGRTKSLPKVQELVPLAESYRGKGRIVSNEHASSNASSMLQEPVAIVGMSGVFPGSRDLNEFWRYLEQETDLITEIPPERWNWQDFHEDYVEHKLKTKSKWGGFVQDVDKFDPRFFKISPLEAEMMDPQQRMFLEVVWKAFEDGGYKISEFSGRNVGIFAGVQFSDYQKLLASEGELNAQMGLGNEHSILVNRISYLFNFHGPSEPYNTACASAGTAIHRAVSSIRMGESELAIAGGICLNLAPHTMISSDQLGILSPDGKCKTLDQGANGYVKGEGVAAVLLKPLSKAIRDRDNIHAVIKGTAVNHGGKATSLTAPNSKAQTKLLVEAYENAGVSPATVTYHELHGTGTELGDPVEIEGLKSAYKELSEKRNEKLLDRYCGIGSVKTNIGHLEPASGIAGLLKVVLSMKNRKLPGLLHLNKVNSYVRLDDTPFYIVDRTREWQRLKDAGGAEVPLRAGVSSFGFGGANSHIVLEEHVRTSRTKPAQEPQIFVLSAKNKERLREQAVNLLIFLKGDSHNQDARSFVDLIYTLQVGREEMEARMSCIVRDERELMDVLDHYINGRTERINLYEGSAAAVGNNSGAWTDDEEIRLRTQELAAQKDWHRIAEQWVSGMSVDWKQLYGNDLPYRISLPTYPFARERYWAPKSGSVHIIPQQASGNASRNKAAGFGSDGAAPTHAASPAAEHIVSHSSPAGQQGGGFFDVLPAANSTTTEQDSASGDHLISELSELFAAILKLSSSEIDPYRNVEEYGIDSIVSSIITQKIQETMDLSIPLSAIGEYPTLHQLAGFISEQLESEGRTVRPAAIPSPSPSAVPARKVEDGRAAVSNAAGAADRGSQTGSSQMLPPELIPLVAEGRYQKAFFVHGGPGLAAFYTSLSKALGSDYPFYVFQARGVDGKTMPRDFEEMVTHYMKCIRIAQGTGPYVIGGYSFGGVIAYEMAQRFRQQGEEVSKLIIFDTFPPDPEANAIFYSNSDPNNAFFKLMMGNEFANARKNRAALILPKDLEGVHPFLHIPHIAKLAKERGNNPLPVEDIYNFIAGACRLNDYAGSTYDTYRPQPYDGDVLYFKATEGFVGKDNWMGLDPVNVYGHYDYTGPWRKWVRRHLDIVEVPCDHFNILEEPSLSIVKRKIQSSLAAKELIQT